MTEDVLIDEEPIDAEGMVEEDAAGMSGEQILAAIMNMPNIAEALGKEPGRLDELGAKVCDDYKIDDESRKEWFDKLRDAIKLAMLVTEQKDYPFENAANVKYPLLTTAALQFNARAYPAIVTADRLVKCKVRGRDETGEKAARADRVSEYLSDQLLNVMPEWEEDTDRILVMLPIVGSVFRKVWYDRALRRNVSRLVTAENLVVNYRAASLLAAPRVTERLKLYPHEIEERIRDGRFTEFDYTNVSRGAEDEAGQSDEDESAPHLFLEQHRLLDLDEDGYPEPYIVTVHVGAQKVVRIVANFDQETVALANDGRVLSIRRRDYFVHYQFLPNPEGGFYGLGFGWLLSSTNETINSTLNQLLDAGHMANMQGGLIGSVLGIKEKSIRLERGEWRVINTSAPLSQAILPIKYGEPSTVLFQLLGLMIEAGKELAAIKDVLTGESASTAAVGTTLALIEQGLQVFTSIYKRVHRTLKQELAIHARLTGANADPVAYSAFFDAQLDPQADFNAEDMDILPVSDPQSVTKMQKLTKAQLVMEVSKGNPLINPIEALRRLFEAADIEEPEKLVVPPPEPPPEEIAFMEAVKRLGMQEQVAKINKIMADTLKSIADAEAAEEGMQMSYYDMVMRALQSEHSMEQDLAGAGGPPGGVPGMAGAPVDAAGAGALPVPSLGGAGADAGIAPDVAPPVGAGMGQPAGAGGLPEGAL